MAFYEKRRVNANALIVGDTNEPDVEYRLTDDEYNAAMKNDLYNDQKAAIVAYASAREAGTSEPNSAAGDGTPAAATDAQRSVPPSTQTSSSATDTNTGSRESTR